MTLTKTFTGPELARLRVMVKTFIKSAERKDHSQGYINELHTILSKLYAHPE